MSCQVFEEALSAYIDGELSSQERDALEQHLATCDSCRAMLGELAALRDALRSLPEEELPSGLHEMIMLKVETRRQGFFGRVSARVSKWGYRQWVPVAAAAMVFVMLVSAGGGIWYANMKDSAQAPLAQYEDIYGGGDDSVKFRSMMPTPTAPSAGDGAENTYDASTAKGMLTAGLASTESATMLADADRKIIKRAQLSLEVTRGSVRETSELAINVVKANFGYIESSSIAQSDYNDKELTSFYMVARVPAENLDPTLTQITTLGRTTRQDTSAQDVTDQYVDLDARLKNKENQEQRLLTIMGDAKTVGELLQVEGELSRVRGEIESMKAQIQSYDKSVTLSTVSLTLTEEGAVKPSSSQWTEVWRVFVNAWRTLAIFLAKVAPAVIVLALLFGIIALILRRRRIA